MATILTRVTISDYNLCASFIANNRFDFHVINYFYWDWLTNIWLANSLKVRHEPDTTPVKLIDDVFYNAYDGYGWLTRFDIKEVLYIPDFITNIVSIRLAKQHANLFFKMQFGCVYNANSYIHAITIEIAN